MAPSLAKHLIGAESEGVGGFLGASLDSAQGEAREWHRKRPLPTARGLHVPASESSAEGSHNPADLCGQLQKKTYMKEQSLFH